MIIELVTSIGESKVGRKKQPNNTGKVLEVDHSLSLNCKHLQGWKFDHSMIITGEKGRDAVIVTNEKMFLSVGGVYAVYHHDELLYIGSYTNSFQYRWINKLSNKNCKRVFRHFKGAKLQEKVRESDVHAHVYVLPLNLIRQKYPDIRWVNQYGVESELIRHFNPPMNKRNTKKDVTR